MNWILASNQFKSDKNKINNAIIDYKLWALNKVDSLNIDVN